MRHPDYPIWSFLALVLVTLPAPWHWRARNVATLSIIMWLSLANLTNLVNTSIWADNYRDNAPIWCDISSRIILLITFAIPACSLSQMRRLESVASTRRSVVSSRERRRRMIEELLLCVVIPIVLATLSYIVQGHRYDILENIGCQVPVYMSIPGVIIRFVAPLILSVTSLIFAMLAIRWFLVRRLQFRSILASSNSGLSVSRYLRLIALAAMDSTLLSAFIIYDLVYSLSDWEPLQTYQSWSQVHVNYSQVAQYPEELYPSGSYYGEVANTYSPIVYSILFFIFFGFGEEAITEYLALGQRIVSWQKRWTYRAARHRQPQYEDRALQLGSKVVPANHSTDNLARHTDDMEVGDGGVAGLSSNFDATRTARDGVAVLVEKAVV